MIVILSRGDSGDGDVDGGGGFFGVSGVLVCSGEMIQGRGMFDECEGCMNGHRVMVLLSCCGD